MAAEAGGPVMARLPSWIVVESEGPENGEYVLNVRLARFFWLRPSFWRYMFRERGQAE